MPLVSLSLAQQAPSPFVSIPAAPSEELRFGPELPEFEAKDINGRVWRLNDLRGKLTVVYVWGTFLAQATDELDPHARSVVTGMLDLPEIQRFHDKVSKGRKIRILTFCQDYDYTHAPAYMRQTKYTFPVIADWVLLNRLLPRAGESRQWLINAEGRLSVPMRSWSLGRFLFEVERAAAQNEKAAVR